MRFARRGEQSSVADTRDCVSLLARVGRCVEPGPRRRRGLVAQLVATRNLCERCRSTPDARARESSQLSGRWESPRDSDDRGALAMREIDGLETAGLDRSHGSVGGRRRRQRQRGHLCSGTDRSSVSCQSTACRRARLPARARTRSPRHRARSDRRSRRRTVSRRPAASMANRQLLEPSGREVERISDAGPRASSRAALDRRAINTRGEREWRWTLVAIGRERISPR